MSEAAPSARERAARRTVCFIGGARYRQPLDTTAAGRVAALSGIARVFVIGFSEDARPRCFTEAADFYLLPNLSSPILRYALMGLCGPVLALWCVLRHRAGIIVAQSPYEGVPAALAAMTARLAGVKVALVVESHGDYEESIFMHRRIRMPVLYRWCMKRASRFALARADAVRVVSASTRRQVMRVRPHVPCVEFAAWTDLGVFLRAGAQRGTGRSGLIVCAALLTPRKGVHVLIDAFRSIGPERRGLRLHVIGDALNEEYAKALKAQADQAGLRDQVLFAGGMPQGQLAEQIARADLFVLPSFSEGLPRVVFEAMACGTPVVASDVSGIPELIADGDTGFLVPAGDPVRLADRMRWLLDHPDESRRMGQRARELAAQVFSTEKYLEGYTRLFQLAAQS